MDSTQTTPFTHISLCAGYGGIDLALSRVIRGLRTIALSEIEAFACANLVAKMEAGLLDTAPIWSNLKTFGWRRFCGRVGILSGGFPCQPFSAAGKRGGDEDPRHLFPHILRGIIECQPELVFLENVEGIISAKLKGDGWNDPAGTPVLLHVLRELERVGYRATAGVFSSAEVGASHQRKRVFILAMANCKSRGALSEEQSGRLRILGRIGQELADTLHDGHSSAERPSSARPSENQGWLRQPERMGSPQRNVYLRPKPPGADQWWWEPKRILIKAVGDPKVVLSDGGDNHTGVSMGSGPLSKSRDTGRTVSVGNASLSNGRQQDGYGQVPIGGASVGRSAIEPSLGRDSDGSSHWLDYAKLSATVDSRTDELRLLGNGVDPDVVAKAFVTLYNRLNP